MIQWLRSLVYVLQIYFMMLVIGVVFAPWAFFSKHGARMACKTFSRWCFWTARWMVGLHTQVLGDVPQGEAIIAAKHQSFLDIMLIFEACPNARFVMKKEILWTPVIGLYARRLNCIAVDRGKKTAAIDQMVEGVQSDGGTAGQLIIYPQGTRVKPGVVKPYKVGTGVLYEKLGQPCVPVATNVGMFWPRTGIIRRPGLATVEFLTPIAPGKDIHAFLAELEDVVEAKSNALMAEVSQ